MQKAFGFLSCVAALIFVLLSVVVRFSLQRPTKPRLSADAQKCWSNFQDARTALVSAPSFRNESFLAWAERHGVDVSDSEIKLRKGAIGGIELGQDKRTLDEVFHIPAALALFMHSHASFHEPADLSCLQLLDSHEEKIAGLVLALVAEAGRGSRSAWSPYIEQLPKLADFHLNPLLSPLEETSRFEGLEAADYSRQHQEDARNTFKQLSNRPNTCLQGAAVIASYDEYIWARLVVETRALELRICNSEISALLPVYDSMNTGHAGTFNVRISSRVESNTPSFSMMANVQISPGEELVIHYKEAPNDELAATWGFILPGNKLLVDRLPEKACKRLRLAKCIISGCLFAPLRDEACRPLDA